MPKPVEKRTDTPVLVTQEPGAPLPRFGYVRFTFHRRSNAFTIRLEDRASLPPWRDDLIAATKGSLADLSTFLAKLTSTLKKEVPKERVPYNAQSLVSLEVKDATVDSVIAHIARQAQIKITNRSKVNDRMTLSAKDAPWQEILSILAHLLGVYVHQSPSGLVEFIHPDDYLKSTETHVLWPKLDLSSLPPEPIRRESKSFHAHDPTYAERQYDEAVRNLAPIAILNSAMTKGLTGKNLGRLDFDPMTKCFIVHDTKEVIDRAKRILDALEAKSK